MTHTQLYSYLTDNNLLTPHQSGFRKGFSTGTCLISFLDEIFTNIDTSRVLFVDLRKAFDTVDHGILLRKLHSDGLKYPAISWFKSYLSNRYQITKMNNCMSTPCEVNCGVPQCSILGPLLFTLYVNDLPSQVRNGTCFPCTDHMAITVSGLDSEEIEWK